MHSTTIDLGFV
jgi:hypothetical protein